MFAIRLALFALYCLLVGKCSAQTMDELIAQASQSRGEIQTLGDSILEDTQSQGNSDTVIVELDIMYTKKEWQEILQMSEDQSRDRHRRKAIRGIRYRWPGNVVRFELEKGTFNHTEQRVIRSAMAELAKQTCIHFIPAKAGDRNSLLLRDGTGSTLRFEEIKECNIEDRFLSDWSACLPVHRAVWYTHHHSETINYSAPPRPPREACGVDGHVVKLFFTHQTCSSRVGMKGGKQNIFLARGCRTKGIVMHELGHALGFYHEQARLDRDEYLTILEENIKDGKKDNFRKNLENDTVVYDVDYDYRSIMHYGPRWLSKNENPTITTKYPAFQEVIGRRDKLSFRDIKLANLMYSCNAGCPNKACPGEGFVGNNCECWCPGNPVTPCGTGKEQTDFMVTIETGTSAHAGTDSQIYITLTGEKGQCDEYWLDRVDYDDFQKGATDKFLVPCGDTAIGELLFAKLNNTGTDGLYVTRIQIESLSTDRVYNIPCNFWLDDDKNHLLERTLVLDQNSTRWREHTLYLITVEVGTIENAYTVSPIFITLHGTRGKCGEFCLDPPNNDYELGSVRSYRVPCPNNFGSVRKITMENKGTDDVYLDKVTVKSMATGRVYNFTCNQWLDGMVEGGRQTRVFYAFS